MELVIVLQIIMIVAIVGIIFYLYKLSNKSAYNPKVNRYNNKNTPEGKTQGFTVIGEDVDKTISEDSNYFAKLVLLDGGEVSVNKQIIDKKVPILIYKPTVNIGRDDESDIKIPQNYRSVSRHHCVIRFDTFARHFDIYRHKNAHGSTWVNGEEVKKDNPLSLHNGDKISIPNGLTFQFYTRINPTNYSKGDMADLLSDSTRLKLFISYSRVDVEIMRQIRNDLHNTLRGIEIWVDEELRAGGVWQNILEEKIKDATGLIVLLSPDSKQSGWVRREITHAMTNDIPIFPVLIRGNYESSVPMALNDVHYTDLRRNKYESGIQRLADTIGEHLWKKK